MASLAFGVTWLAAAVVLVLLGGVLELESPGPVGLVWRAAVLAALMTVGGLVVPLPFAGVILAAVGLAVLFDVDIPEDWATILIFCVAMGIVSVLLAYLISSVLFTEGPAGSP